jgi:serine/threonine protein kinase
MLSGHESLYRAGILHRDISHGNIMLSEQDGDGFLIDLDHAIRLVEHKPSKGARKTGTGVFMAIQVLMGEHHTFKHDLESFFWVLFWLGIHWDGPNRKRRTGTVFSKWNTMTTRDLAIAKMGEVFDADIFSEDMENHFSDYCKALIPCLMGLHDEIFGPLWRKDDDEALYSRMINVLEEARQEL